jgi:hypothetical protein
MVFERSGQVGVGLRVCPSRCLPTYWPFLRTGLAPSLPLALLPSLSLYLNNLLKRLLIPRSKRNHPPGSVTFALGALSNALGVYLRSYTSIPPLTKFRSSSYPAFIPTAAIEDALSSRPSSIGRRPPGVLLPKRPPYLARTRRRWPLQGYRSTVAQIPHVTRSGFANQAEVRRIRLLLGFTVFSDTILPLAGWSKAWLQLISGIELPDSMSPVTIIPDTVNCTSE